MQTDTITQDQEKNYTLGWLIKRAWNILWNKPRWSGRISVGEYRMASGIVGLLFLVLVTGSSYIITNVLGPISPVGGVVEGILSLGQFIMLLSLLIKRSHDLDKSRTYVLVLIIASCFFWLISLFSTFGLLYITSLLENEYILYSGMVVGVIFIIWSFYITFTRGLSLLFKKGTKGENQYGVDPLLDQPGSNKLYRLLFFIMILFNILIFGALSASISNSLNQQIDSIGDNTGNLEKVLNEPLMKDLDLGNIPDTLNNQPMQDTIINVPAEYYPDYLIAGNVESLLQTIITLEAVQSGKEPALSLFSTFNTVFNVLFAYFPQTPNYQITYEQCRILSSDLSTKYSNDVFVIFKEKCLSPINGIIRQMQQGGTIKIAVQVLPKDGPAPHNVTLDARGSLDPSGDTIPNDNYFWYYKDDKGKEVAIGRGPIIFNYTFPEPGTYIVHLTVRSVNNTTKGVFDGSAKVSVNVGPRVDEDNKVLPSNENTGAYESNSPSALIEQMRKKQGNQ